MPDRDLSVVVFGASGVTGRGVAAYLAARAGEVGGTWAVAGRDPGKLERVLGELGVTPPETIVADVDDPASLARMASRTRVVLDLVGPYTLYGGPVIEACVGNGAHYADLSGEMPFVRQVINAYHDQATAAGLKIVQTSGFEALPPDLAVLLAAETARERWNEELEEATFEVEVVRQPAGRPGFSDLISGGTMQGMAEVLDGEGAADIADPAILIADPGFAAEIRRRSPISLTPRFSARGDVIGPMSPAAFINPPIVHRTVELLNAERDRPARPLRYREGIAMPGSTATLPLRYGAAAALGAAQAGYRALTHAQPSVRRRLAHGLRTILPSSGFGPTGERLNDWAWRASVDARTDGGHYVRIDIDADGHPGYLTTSRMLGEVGLLLSDEGATPARAGCLTPAAALGTTGLDRFERAGVRFALSS